MDYSVVWTPDAEHDLDVVVSYLATTLGSRAAASKLLDGMDSLVRTLSTFPYAHELVRDRLLAKRGYRKATVESYVVLYLVSDATNEVVITNVMHGSQDYLRHV